MTQAVISVHKDLNFSHARAITAQYSKSFYLAASLLPKSKRWAIYAVYGYCRYIDNLVDEPRNRSDAELITELAQAEDELKIAYRTGDSLHPVFGPFIKIANEYEIPIDYPMTLIDGSRMDISIHRYQTFSELYEFCYKVASVVGLMATHVMGPSDPSAYGYAEKLGIGLQLTNILRDIKEDKDRGRIYIPQEDLQKYGLTDDDIINERFSASFTAMIKAQIDRAKTYYQAALPGVAMLPMSCRIGTFSAIYVYQAILDELEKQQYNPFMKRVHVGKLAKLGHLCHSVFSSLTSENRGSL